MTKQEFDEMAALVVRLRKELEHTNQHLVAHIDALTKSNAQCGEYLRQNEMLAADRATLYAELQTVIAERDKEYEAGALMQNKLAETTKDLSYSRLAVDTMRARDMRFTETIAKCGAAAGEDIGDFIERAVACRDQFHRELVNVRAALASVTEQRDSLKRTLDEWERADTKPHALIDPPIRMGLISETGPVVFVRIGPKPADDDVADHVAPPVLPMCMTCHHCGNALDASVFGPYNVCTTIGCPRTVTNNDDGSDKNPYDGPCHAGSLVRHE